MVAILPLVFACSGRSGAAAPPVPVNSQAVLVTADWEPPGTFDPLPATTVTRLRADTLLFRRLWIEAPGSRLVPDLAAAVPAATDSELRVRLRTGLRWSDGDPLGAADVAFSWNAVCDPANHAWLAPACAGVDSVSRDGPSAVSFRLHEPAAAATLRSALADLFILPAHRLQGAGAGWNSFFAAPDVASGPFRLAAPSPGRLVFERNPLYGGHRPYLAEIVELLLPSHTAIVAAAQDGEVDLLPHLGPADVGTSIGGLRTVVTASEREELLQPSGLDPSLVAAIGLATDPAALVQQALPGGRPAGGGRNPALARLLLRGASPHLTLAIPCNDAVRAQEAAVLAAQWLDAGITAAIRCGAPVNPGLALTARLEPIGAGALPLAVWPDVRAVSPRLHGFAADDSSATDYWNAAGWWLQ